MNKRDHESLGASNKRREGNEDENMDDSSSKKEFYESSLTNRTFVLNVPERDLIDRVQVNENNISSEIINFEKRDIFDYFNDLFSSTGTSLKLINESFEIILINKRFIFINYMVNNEIKGIFNIILMKPNSNFPNMASITDELINSSLKFFRNFLKGSSCSLYELSNAKNLFINNRVDQKILLKKDDHQKIPIKILNELIKGCLQK